MPVLTIGSRLRLLALLLVAALSLHEARYLLVSGEYSGLAHVHGYLELLAPILAVVAAAAVVASLLAPLVHRRLPRLADPSAATERAAAYAIALLAIFFCQELIEGLVADQGALGGIAGPGGWLALPLAIGLGALVEAARGRLEQVERRVAVAVLPRPRRAVARVNAPRMPVRVPLCSRPLAFGLGRRPPPPFAV
jgi:hypothetical protein